MFKITNNNISITRGETATYDAVFKHTDGTPFILDKNLISGDKDIYGLFSVKLSMYDENPVFSVPMKLNQMATFDTGADIIDIGDEVFDNTNVPDVNVVFDNSDENKYVYNTSTPVFIDNDTRFMFNCKTATTNLIYLYFDNKFYLCYDDGYWHQDTTLTQNTPGNISLANVYCGVWHSGNKTFLDCWVGSTPSKHYLVDDTSLTPFQEISYTGATPKPRDIWTDGTTTYFSDGTHDYTFDNSTYAFTQSDLNVQVIGRYVWKDTDGTIYYTNGTTAYKWNSSQSRWDSTTTNMSVTGDKIYNIYDRIYYVDKTNQSNNKEYVLTSTSSGLVWSTLETPMNIPLNTYLYKIFSKWYTIPTNSYSTSPMYYKKGRLALDNRNDKLYRSIINDVPSYYVYVGNTVIVTEDDFEEYEFRLVFPFPYNIMKSLQPKLYKYEIALVGGTPTDTINDQTAITTQLPLTVDFKQYLVEFKDFKVEGSLSE